MRSMDGCRPQHGWCSASSPRPHGGAAALLCAMALWIAHVLPAMCDAQGSGSQPSGQNADDTRLQQLCEQLGSEKFIDRERATRDLIGAGMSAIPFVIKAARSENREQSFRGLRVLDRLARQQTETGKAAIAALRQLGGEGTAASRMATHLIDALNARSRQDNIKRLESLGAEVKRIPGQIESFKVLMQQGWQGTDADMVLVKRLGNVSWLSIERSTLGDRCLEHLAGLRNLERLYLGESQVRGPGLVHLQGLSKLEHLSLRKLKLTDDSVGFAAELSQLESIGLDDTDVSNAALKHLKKMTRLKEIWLDRSKVSPAGMKHLLFARKLEKLNLAGTRMVGSGLKDLKTLSSLQFLTVKSAELDAVAYRELGALVQLQTLGLDHTTTGDKQLVHLRSLRNLQTLWLSKTKVSDGGIDELAGLKSLKALYLHGSAVSPMGVELLARSLPECKSYR